LLFACFPTENLKPIVLASFTYGLKPVPFEQESSGLEMTCGGGSVWTLNQGDGTVSRVDEKSRKVTATIQAGIPGAGGDIDYGAESVWPTAQGGVPLTRIDSTTNKVVRQWVGKGGDSLRLGFGSIWITDYKQGLLLRIPVPQLLKQGTSPFRCSS